MQTREVGAHTLERVREHLWELPQDGEMRVPGRLLANDSLLAAMSEDDTLQQLRDTAHLPGIQRAAFAMPDAHRGSGVPVGGVAATDAEDGVISPGAVGFDINCGVRLVRTTLTSEDLRGREEALVEALFEAVPAGPGPGAIHDGTTADVEAILERGMGWALEAGYAVPADLEHCEDQGSRPEGTPAVVSTAAIERGADQLGSLGSGNHFFEVQTVTDVYREEVAAAFGLEPDQVVVMIHCGSRGLGHQIGADYLEEVRRVHRGLNDRLPSEDLAAAPAGSPLAEDYYRAMCGGVNFAWVNRQVITHRTREVFADVFEADWEALGMELLYDVAHNVAKRETHTVDGRDRELFVHRRGATRAFPAGHPAVPAAYRTVGQPVIVPGSMGTSSYVLRGGDRSLAETFGSTAHGAGRTMSRTQARDTYRGEDVRADLREREGVHVEATSTATIAEGSPGVYKDVSAVVAVSEAVGIADRVARTRPVCSVKG